MKNQLKKINNYILKKIINFLFSFNLGRYFLEIFSLNINSKFHVIEYKNKKYKFYTPNRLSHFRAQTFLTKEPETIRWIENFDEGSVFWDIGANIGLYSCFAAKEKNTTTYSFEPSVFNLDMLVKNIYENQVNNKVIVIPVSLTDKMKISDFNLSNIESGGSQSTFSENYGPDGNEFIPKLKYKTLGLNGNDIVNKLNIKKPEYIKIDVDGIEFLILKGLSEILDEVKSILIEVNETFQSQKNNIKEFLKNQNFILDEKNYSKTEKTSNKRLKTYNQIWNKLQK